MKAKALHGLTIGLLITTAPTALLAQAEAAKGWSVEAKALDVESSGTASRFVLDDERTGLSIGGGYAFNEYVAVHATVADYGDHFATDCPPPLVCAIQNVDRVDVRTLAVGVTGTWPVTRLIELFGTLGYAGWNADFAAFDIDETDRDVVVGAGIGARIKPDWRISLQVEKLHGLDLESVGVGFAYRF